MKRLVKKIISRRIKPILRKLRYIVFITIYNICVQLFQVEENRVFFLSDSRDEIGGNFKYIYDELKKNHPEFELLSVLKVAIRTRRSLKDKFRLPYYIATSKFILVDDYYPMIYPLKIRQGSRLIQVWHALGAFKTVGHSRIGKQSGPEETSIIHKNYTDAIVSSEDIRCNYAEAFGISIDKVRAVGVPRTDDFFDKKLLANTREEIFKKYPMIKGKKVVLFAPTFRGAGQKSARYDFDLIDFEKIYKELKDKNYVFLISMHPFVRNMDDMELPEGSEDFFIDLGKEKRINDVLLVADTLITDYSSSIFDYAFLNKPVVFFTPDYEEYFEDRGFYYSFEEYTYGPVAENTAQLIKCIKDAKVDDEKLKKFKKKFISSCDGKSTKRFVKELIIKHA